VRADGAGWHDGDTGLTAEAISAVNTGGPHLQAMALNNGGLLYQVWGDNTGWHEAATGVGTRFTAVSAANRGGGWPTAMALGFDRHIHEIYGDAQGWHDGDTGLTADAVAAVNMGGVHLQVMALDGGKLYQIWGDNTGWHKASTGIGTSFTALSAVNKGGGWPTVMALGTDGDVYEVYGNSGGWHAGDTGKTADCVSAVDMGGQHLQVMTASPKLRDLG
jgi:murein DD-endopeptidase